MNNLFLRITCNLDNPYHFPMVNYPLWLEQTSNSNDFKTGESLNTRFDPPNNQFWSKSLSFHLIFPWTSFFMIFQQEGNKWQKWFVNFYFFHFLGFFVYSEELWGSWIFSQKCRHKSTYEAKLVKARDAHAQFHHQRILCHSLRR